jgi:hypothetical protein
MSQSRFALGKASAPEPGRVRGPPTLSARDASEYRPAPMPTLTVLFGMLRAALIDRQRLMIENAVLHQQVIVLKRSVTRPRIQDSDRVFWILMHRLLSDWKSCMLIVKPETLIRWHRKGAAYYWARTSRTAKRGAPAIGWKLVRLIQRLSIENVTWGAPRIRDELVMLGQEVAQSTVEKYMVKNAVTLRRAKAGRRSCATI